MKLNLYSVLDEKSQIFSQMFFRRTHGEAIRFFGDACMDQKTVLFQHPEDFRLYFHGSFDVESGMIESICPIQFIASALDFKTGNGRVVDEVRS